MSEKTPNFTKAQLFAIESRSRDLLLSAGAGAGKTATLTERVCRLVTDEASGVDVSRMLIVTFTRAAAAELRERVRERLEAALSENPSSRRLARQLVALDGADISTISGFLLKSIRPYFSELGLPPSFAVADEATVNVMKSKIMSEVIDDFFDEGSPSFIALADALSSSRDEASMNETVLKIANTLFQKGFSQENLSEKAAALEEASTSDFFASSHGKVVREITESFARHYLAAFKSASESITSDPFLTGKYGASAEEHVRFAEALVAHAGTGYKEAKDHIESFAPSKLPPIKAEAKSDEAISFGELKKEFKEKLSKDIAPLFAYEEKDISAVQIRTAALLRELARVVGEFSRRFSEAKRERGVVDYNDIELYAKELFVAPDGGPSAAALALCEKYDCMFIDEYQDTNSLQDAIFTSLAAKVPRFMVGDVKQSIYAFRGAEPAVFASYRKKMKTADVEHDVNETDPRMVFMSENFRSDSTVIDFVNVVSEVMFAGTSTPFEKGDRLIFSKGHREGYVEHPAEVALIEKPEKKEGERAVSDDEVEAEYTASRIASMLTHEVRGNGERIEPRDISILLRSSLDAPVFESALRRRGIAVSDRATLEFFEQKEVLLVLCLLNAIDNPFRDIYLAGALKSPVFGFTVEDLIKIKLGRSALPLFSCLEEFDDVASPLYGKCRAALGFISKYSKLSRGKDSASVILSLYNEFSLYSMTDGAAPDSARAAAVRENLTALYEMARRYEASSFGGLYGFITYLGEMMQKSSTVEKAEDDNAVSIMTIHKSKGLEFPICFIGRTSKRFNMKDVSASVLFDPDLGPALKMRDETGLVRCDNPLRVAVSKKMRYDAVSEEMRVIYVAMTRARERLVIPVATTSAASEVKEARLRAERQSTYSAYTSATAANAILPAAIFAADLNAPFIKLVTVPYSEVEGESVNSEKTQDVAVQSEDINGIIKERLAFRYPREHLADIPAKITVSKLSPSLLDDEETVTDIELAEFLRGAPAKKKKADIPILRLTPDDEPSGAERGTATHVFLQFCDFEKLESDGFEAELSRLSERRFLTTRMASLVNREEIESFAKSGLFGMIKSARRIWREFRFNSALKAYNFTTDEALGAKLRESGDDIIVQGVCDLVIEDERGELILVDYKTDRLSAYQLSHPEEARKELRERHRSQLSYYKVACEKIFERRIDRVLIYSLALGDICTVE